MPSTTRNGAPPPRLRFLISLALGLLAGLQAYRRAVTLPTRDFSLIWYAARAVLHGQNPYDLIGPGRPYEYVAGLFYPLPGVLVGVPFTPLPTAAACGIFMIVAAGCFAWALMEHGTWPLVGFFSASMFFTAEVVQWSPLFAAAVVIPPLSIVYWVKPQIGAAMFAARPNWWAIGWGVLLLTIACVIQPDWVSAWRGELANGASLGASSTGYPYRAPVLLPGGVLVLLALTRWRRPEARLLVALACVPQSLLLYDTVPLFLIPRRRGEAILLCASSMLTLWLAAHLSPPDTFAEYALLWGRLSMPLLYLPCTLMVLRRPNEGTLPAWLEQRISAWPAWLRGRAPIHA